MNGRARWWTRWLRIARLACTVWLMVALGELLAGSSAAADNCGTFSDCFDQANSAAEAGFGLMLLTGLSMVLNFIPIVGDVKGVAEAVTGRDLLTGTELEPWERALGLIPLIPLGDAARSLRGIDDLTDLARLGDEAGDLARLTDEASDLARMSDDAGDLTRITDDATDLGRLTDGSHAATDGVGISRPSPGVGEHFKLPQSSRSLVDEYPTATPSRKTAISEELGEQGALRYLQETGSSPDLPMLHPTTDAEVAGYAAMVDDGEAWPQAVAFGGGYATNVVYFDGATMHIVEAKGGGGTYGDRLSIEIDRGNRISQTHPEYPRDVAGHMTRSSLSDGRNEIGDAIREAYKGDQVRYVGVRTGGRTALMDGNPTVTIEHVFQDVPP